MEVSELTVYKGWNYKLLDGGPCGLCRQCAWCHANERYDIWHIKARRKKVSERIGFSVCSDCLREKGLIW